MKKTVLTLIAALGLQGAIAQNGDLYKRYVTVSGGYQFSIPSDYIVDGTTRAVAIVPMDSVTKSGAGVIKIDLNAGTSITGKVYTATAAGNTYGAARVLSIGGNYYLLGTYINSTAQTTALTKINATTGAVVFSEYLTGKKCGLANLYPTDMVYDGSAYIYAMGMVVDARGLDQTWVAKFDLSGVLQWIKCLQNTQYGSDPQNLYYYNDTSIYVGCKVGVGFLQTTGMIARIDNNAAIKQAKTISYFTFPNGGSLRMSVLNIKRNGSYLYVVGQPLLGRDDVGGLMIVKLDLNMNLVAYHVFDSSPYGFEFNPEFYFETNGGSTKILVPGSTNPYDNGTYNGYVNAFFDLNTNFLNANNLGLNSNIFGTQLSYPASTGHIFSVGQDASTNADFYYMKGAPGNDHTTCDSTFSFYTENDSLYLATYPLVDSTMSNGTCTFTLAITTPTFTANSICYFCAACQREAEPTTTPVVAKEPVSLYPNPSNGHITANFSFDAVKNIHVEVTNSVGASVYKTSHNGIEKTSIEYDLSSLPKGMYMVRITDGGQTNVIKKIIIE